MTWENASQPYFGGEATSGHPAFATGSRADTVEGHLLADVRDRRVLLHPRTMRPSRGGYVGMYPAVGIPWARYNVAPPEDDGSVDRNLDIYGLQGPNPQGC